MHKIRAQNVLKLTMIENIIHVKSTKTAAKNYNSFLLPLSVFETDFVAAGGSESSSSSCSFSLSSWSSCFSSSSMSSASRDLDPKEEKKQSMEGTNKQTNKFEQNRHQNFYPL